MGITALKKTQVQAYQDANTEILMTQSHIVVPAGSTPNLSVLTKPDSTAMIMNRL
jgi:hypothetical protein